MKRFISLWAVALGVGLFSTIALPPLARGQQPVTLEPGKAVRIHISTQPGNEPGSSVIIRIELEGAGDGGAKPPTSSKLRDELAALYQKDGDPDKQKHGAALADLYRWSAEAVLDREYATAGKFRDEMGRRSLKLLPADVLLPLRRRVRDELRTVLPYKPSPSSTPLDPATRQAASRVFNNLAAVMGELAGAGQAPRRQAGENDE
jgi:hypothetical protein